MKILGVANWGLLLPVCILCLFGLTTLFSIDLGFFRNQLLFFIVCLVVYFVVARTNIQFIRNYSFIIYMVSIFLLFLILAIGFESRGAVRWIDLFGFQIQFSEVLKPFLGLCLASFLTTHKERSFPSFFVILLFLLPVVLLIAIQPDLGSALIYLGATLFFLIAFGYPIWWFAAGFGGIALMLPIFWHFLHSYQQQRLLTFIHPTNDPLGTSYNAIQSVIAVGSGMFAGQGLGQGTQSGLRFLPERHTDFIFATLSEGLGFVGTIIIIGVFLFLLYRIYILFLNQQDDFVKNLSLVAFGILVVQFFINIGMNIGLLPIVGVPLPFVSYGGSSLLSSFLLLGLLTAASHTRKTHKTLEIR